MDFVKEKRAFEMLQWVPYSLPCDYDLLLAAKGHYTKLQTERSDRAFDECSRQNVDKSISELQAFRTLHELGIFSDDTLFSPHKSKSQYYTTILRNQRLSAGSSQVKEPRRANSRHRARIRLASIDEKCG